MICSHLFSRSSREFWSIRYVFASVKLLITSDVNCILVSNKVFGNNVKKFKTMNYKQTKKKQTNSNKRKYDNFLLLCKTNYCCLCLV